MNAVGSDLDYSCANVRSKEFAHDSYNVETATSIVFVVEWASLM